MRNVPRFSDDTRSPWRFNGSLERTHLHVTRISSSSLLVALALAIVASSAVTADETEERISEQEKVDLIQVHGQKLSHSDRLKFARGGEFVAVGRLVTVGRDIYFKSADQSFLPENRRFPYPELMFQLYLGEQYAYEPLSKAQIFHKRRLIHDGPIQIRGNWAYDGPQHLFALTWIDDVQKVSECPEGNWSTWKTDTQ